MLLPMGYLTSLFARKMVAAAGDEIDASALLTEAGIDPDGPLDPKVMIPAATLEYVRTPDVVARPAGVRQKRTYPLQYGIASFPWREDQAAFLGSWWKPVDDASFVGVP